MTDLPPGNSGVPRRFEPKPVPLSEWTEMARDAALMIGAAPVRLIGLYLLVYLPIQLFPNFPYVAIPIRATIGAIGFTGFFLALDAARSGRPPTIVDMALAWRLPAGKLAVLALSGLLPIACMALVWWLDLGGNAVNDLLSGRLEPDKFTPHQQLDAVLAIDFAGLPLFFLQPLCMLAPWSASRTLSANFIACAVNWRWVLALTLLQVPIDIGTSALGTENGFEQLLSLLSELAVAIVLSAFTLRLLQRSLEN